MRGREGRWAESKRFNLYDGYDLRLRKKLWTDGNAKGKQALFGVWEKLWRWSLGGIGK